MLEVHVWGSDMAGPVGLWGSHGGVMLGKAVGSMSLGLAGKHACTVGATSY